MLDCPDGQQTQARVVVLYWSIKPKMTVTIC